LPDCKISPFNPPKPGPLYWSSPPELHSSWYSSSSSCSPFYHCQLLHSRQHGGYCGHNAAIRPRWTGLRYLEDVNELYNPATVNYSYDGSTFSVLACPIDTPQGNGLGQSDAGKILKEMHDLSWGEWSDEKDMRFQVLEPQLASLIGDACFPLMQELAPISIPEPRTSTRPHTLRESLLRMGD
jgi:hypothetical protein